MNELKGKKINKIYISKCKQAIKFECDDKVYKYEIEYCTKEEILTKIK